MMAKIPRIFITLFTALQLALIGYSQSMQPRFGQYRLSRYYSAQDSLDAIKIQGDIEILASRRPFNQKKYDSLMGLYGTIFKRMAYKNVYAPSRDFIIDDSLAGYEDLSEVTQVSVNRKKNIPDIVFRCENLVELELVNCTIDELPRQLDRLPNLKSLSIYNNSSKRSIKLPANKTIIRLIIKNENPRGIPNSFRPFEALESLDLAENKLTRFPNGARHNKHLLSLGLQQNEITLKNRIKKHPHLERLALQNNKIEYIPRSIRNCPGLKKLYFNLNPVSNVHPAIGTLKKIENISFYSNHLSEIPAGVYQLPNLLEIDLFHNQIENIEPEFANWQKLTTLYLSHNKLTSLPENLDTLSQLSGLYAWDNRIGKLPDCLGKMNNLKFIRVNNNYIKALPENMLDLSQLEELDISHNYIGEIPSGLFDLPNLKILAIMSNTWNARTLKLLESRVEEARAKGVFVHVSEKE